MMKKRILSGMRPTGPLHLGHLLGALKYWAGLQDEYQCFFMVADWHALMSEYESPYPIKDYTIDNVRDWIASGVNPRKSVIFRQSDVPEHLELAMIFSDLTPLGWLQRCPTYKEQLREIKGKDLTSYGFLGYPVLQASDILVYKAAAVPVGQDQLPHLELTREIARRFHALYRQQIFPLPKGLLTVESKLLGTDRRKMSKSYNNYIALSDTPEAIRKKVMTMITDPKKIKKTDKGHPENCNVYTYHQIFTKGISSAGLTSGSIKHNCRPGKLGCVECKDCLGDSLNEYLSPIRKQRSLYTQAKIKKILSIGAKRARRVAVQTLAEVKKTIGFR